MIRISAISTIRLFLIIVFCSLNVAQAAETIPIGVVYSLTGPGSSLGEIQKEGAQLAAREINEAGGVQLGDARFVLDPVFLDDQTNPHQAIAKVKEVTATRGVSAIVGGTFGHVSMALNHISKAEGLFFMATNGVPERFFQKGIRSPTAFCIMASGESAGRGAAAYIMDNMKAKKVACLIPNYAIGKATLAGFDAVAANRPDVSRKVFWTPINAEDFSASIDGVAEYGPEVVLVGQWGSDAIKMLDQIEKRGLKDKMRVFHFWLTNVFATNIPPEAIQGVWGQMFWYHDMRGFKDPAVVRSSEAFTENYTARYGRPPDPYAMAAFFGVKETVRAMELAGSTDAEKMGQALMAHPQWTSVKGAATWRIDGRPEYRYSTWIVEGKGAENRQSERGDASYDYATISDVYAGDAFLPPPESADD